jgi:hypothetical protein
MQSMNTLNYFVQCKPAKPVRQPVEEVIDKTGAWLYFDRAAQMDPEVCGAGGTVHLSDSHCSKLG